MRYCKFASYMHGDPPADWAKEYESPLYGDNTLYAKVPSDATPLNVLQPKTGDDRYGVISDCVIAITEALEIDLLPMVSYGYMYASPGLFSVANDPYSFMNECISACGYNGKYLEYIPGWKYYAPTPTSDYGVGNIDLTGGYTGCFAFMQVIGDHPLGGNNYCFMQEVAGTDRFVYIFDVFPYDVFRTGVFDFSRMNDATAHPGDMDWKRYCTVRVEIWEEPYDPEDPTGSIVYNCSAQILGSDVNILTLNDNYNGKEVEQSQKKKKDPVDPPPGGGDGGYGPGHRTNDPVHIPDLPSTDMTDVGGLRIYSLTASQLKNFFDYLHTAAPGENILKWIQNPIEAVISLHYLPYAIRYKGMSPEYEQIKILGLSTGVTAMVGAQWQEINFGYCDVEFDSETYLDMSPYTKVSIYLPGIGIRDLNIDEVIGNRVWCVYHCDNVTGQFMAYVAIGVNKKDASVRYTYSGQVAATFPISQNNWGQTYIAGATMLAAAGAAGLAMVGGAAAAAGGGAAAGAGAAAEGAGAAAEGAGAAASGFKAASLGKGAVNVGNSVASLAKPSISRSGSVSATTSLFAVKKPYLIFESPNYQSFAGFASTKGYPCGRYYPLSSLSGYTEVESIHLSGITGTAGEIAEIESLLHSGVIL